MPSKVAKVNKATEGMDPMSMMYLLPCSCGAKLPVERRQAGETVRCGCGTSLEVPSLMKMENLEPAEPESVDGRPSDQWGIRQSVILLGAVIAMLGLALGVFLVLSRPEPFVLDIPPELVRREVRTFSPRRSWENWRYMSANGLNRTPLVAKEKNTEELLRWRIQIGVVLVVVALGIATVGVALLSGRRPAERYSRKT